MSRFPTSPLDAVPERINRLQSGVTTGVLSLTPQRLRLWGVRSCLSLFDQAVYSGSTFLLNILLARWFKSEVYGAFAVCFAGFLFVAGFHNVAFIEPMTVIGPSCYLERLTDYFSAQLRAHMFVVGSLFAVGLVGFGILALREASSYLSRTIVAAAISVPFLLLFWLARRMCYVVLNPLIAIHGSIVYAVLLFGGIFWLRRAGWISPAVAFLWMGISALLAVGFVLRRLRVPIVHRPTSKSPSTRQVLKENWSYGHWLMLTTVLSWATGQVQTVLAGVFLGLASAGILRAMQLPSLAMAQVIAATTLLVLPSMSRELAHRNVPRLRKKAVVASGFLAVLGALFATGLFLFAGQFEGLLFGGKFASSAWLIAVLGLAPIFTGFSSSLSLALRALRKSHLELIASVFSATTAIGLALLFMPRWGLRGAAVSIVASTAVLAAAVLVCFLKWGTNSEFSSL